LSVNLSYHSKIVKWSPEPFKVNLLKVPNEILNTGLSIDIPEYNYSDLYNRESNFANCEVKEISLVQNIDWIDFETIYDSHKTPLELNNYHKDSIVDYSKSFFELSNIHGTDKVTYHGYHFFYPLFIENLRDKEFNLLEIGWGSGASVKVWNDYFPMANIFVMDINMEYEIERQKIIKGDQSKEEDLLKITNEIKNAKLIIDDGSHNPQHQLNTFYFLFKNLLEPGGIYIIEDIELSYWNPESTLYGYKTGNVNILHNMIKYQEMINHEFTNVKNTLDISSITYGQNCIIIKKRTEEEKKYFNRIYRFSSVLENIVNWG
jgi:spermidine synthase